MTAEQIKNARQSKTWKIERLLELGKTRQEVADYLEVGYGFVHNVYARLYPERIRNNRRATAPRIQNIFRLENFQFNHTFGVEIEAYGINREELSQELRAAGIQCQTENYNHTTRNHWKVTTDGSLDGVNTFELVSPKLQGEAGLRQLKTALLIVKGLEAKVNRTCSVHIHFDASEFNLPTWKNLYKNYAKLELLIDSFMANSRRGNNNRYCRSMRVQDFERKIESVSNTEALESGLRKLESKIANSGRYVKLNSQSYWRQKSVEFRQHSATVSYEKISNWIKFLARLIEFSKQAEVQTEDWNAMELFLTTELITYFKNRVRELAA